MITLYYIVARLYLWTSALVVPIASLLLWILAARVRHKRLSTTADWLVPTAIGQTLTAAAILLLLFVTLVDRGDYGLASTSYILSVLSMVFGAVSLWRLWKMVDQLPIDPGNQPPDNAPPPEHGVWPPPDRRSRRGRTGVLCGRVCASFPTRRNACLGTILALGIGIAFKDSCKDIAHVLLT